MGWLIAVVAAQLVVASIVVVVLKNVLEKELINVALESFAALKMGQGTSQINIRSASVLNEGIKAQFNALCHRKFAKAQLSFEEDKSLKGGVVIVVGQDILDFSIANRLQQFWS